MNTTPRAPTQDLIELPSTPENVHIRLNYLIARIEVCVSTSDECLVKANDAAVQAMSAKNAAEKISNAALTAIQNYEPISKRSRYATIFAGAGIAAQLAAAGTDPAKLASLTASLKTQTDALAAAVAANTPATPPAPPAP